ncbi:MAG TPA: hypothetical protein VN419_08590, partial [Humidesulfovibrio sp.]|uniref:hypothetical protein n=1 Tax=Humidesulfovibrio sp. TaxID=2910988 RepID=UPI002C2F73CF
MVENWQLLLSILSAGGIGAAAAVGLFKWLGQKWIETRFAERLQHHKHEQAKEIQRLRVEIDSLLSGVLKLQERDFIVLPEAWAKLQEAFYQTLNAVAPYQEYPELNNKTQAQLNEFLQLDWLTGTQKDEIRKAEDRNTVFLEFRFWHYIATARKAQIELQIFIERNGIFFPEDILA